MVQEATKRETLRVAAGTFGGTAVMIAVFAALHSVMPESVPFGFPVILGGLLGALVGTANFFLMGLTVQKVAAEKDEKKAYQMMQVSYRQRILLQIVWIILALTLPFINGAAGIIPIFLPSLVIKVYYIFIQKNASPAAGAEDGSPVTAEPDDEGLSGIAEKMKSISPVPEKDPESIASGLPEDAGILTDHSDEIAAEAAALSKEDALMKEGGDAADGF